MTLAKAQSQLNNLLHQRTVDLEQIPGLKVVATFDGYESITFVFPDRQFYHLEMYNAYGSCGMQADIPEISDAIEMGILTPEECELYLTLKKASDDKRNQTSREQRLKEARKLLEEEGEL